MASPRLTIIKFVDPTRFPTLDEEFALLEQQGFGKAGVAFASVDCSRTQDACTARKIDVDAMTGPIIKFWSGEGFRRYAGELSVHQIAQYLSGKLASMSEEQTSRHARQYAADESATSNAPASPSPFDRLPQADAHATLVWVFQCFGAVLALSYLLYLYLGLPPSEAPASVLVIGCAPSAPHSNLSLVRLDASTGALTPLARLPFERPQPFDAEHPSPLALCVAAGATKGSFMAHMMERPVLPLKAGGRGTAASPPVETSIFSFVVDLGHHPSPLKHVATSALPQPPALDASLVSPIAAGGAVGAGVTAAGERQDTLAFVSSDGAVHVAKVSAPTSIPPAHPSSWSRFTEIVARRVLGIRKKKLAGPESKTVMGATAASVHAAASSRCVVLSLDADAAEPTAGASHVLVTDALADTVTLVSLSGGDEVAESAASSSNAPPAGVIVGAVSTASGARPCALAVNPADPSLCYILCEGDRSVLALSLASADSPPQIAQRVPLPAPPKSGKQSASASASAVAMGHLCVSADGGFLYVVLLGGGGINDRSLFVLSTGVAAARGGGGGRKMALSHRMALLDDAFEESAPPLVLPPPPSGIAPTMALAGGVENGEPLLVVLDAPSQRVYSYVRDAVKGTLKPKACLELEAPTCLASVRWPGQ